MSSNNLYIPSTPSVVSQAKGIHLITMSTPNGQKLQILLEELLAAYPAFKDQYTHSLLDISTNEQKEEWFLRLDPNGRIPILVDNRATDKTPFPVMETSAELVYLQEQIDKEGKFWFTDERDRSEALQWLFFWHGSGAPYMGQVGHFVRAAPEKIPYAITRFQNEVRRVLGVLEIRLSGKFNNDSPRDYLAGPGKGKYSVADIGTWPWVKLWPNMGVEREAAEKEFPHLLKWVERIAEREAVKIGTGEKYSLKK